MTRTPTKEEVQKMIEGLESSGSLLKEALAEHETLKNSDAEKLLHVYMVMAEGISDIFLKSIESSLM